MFLAPNFQLLLSTSTIPMLIWAMIFSCLRYCNGPHCSLCSYSSLQEPILNKAAKTMFLNPKSFRAIPLPKTWPISDSVVSLLQVSCSFSLVTSHVQAHIYLKTSVHTLLSLRCSSWISTQSFIQLFQVSIQMSHHQGLLWLLPPTLHCSLLLNFPL